MSVIYCEKHDIRWDSDEVELCPRCEMIDDFKAGMLQAADADDLMKRLHECIGQYGVQCSETKELAPSSELVNVLAEINAALQSAPAQDRVVVPSNLRHLSDKLTECVAADLNYLENAKFGEQMPTYQETLSLMEGGVHRYRNESLFRVQVTSMVAHIIATIRAAKEQS